MRFNGKYIKLLLTFGGQLEKKKKNITSATNLN